MYDNWVISKKWTKKHKRGKFPDLKKIPKLSKLRKKWLKPESKKFEKLIIMEVLSGGKIFCNRIFKNSE